MKYAQVVLAVIAASCTAVIGYEAPMDGDKSKSIPDRYLISLRRDCTFEQHFQRIGVSQTDEYFNELMDFRRIRNAYGGKFPAEQLQKIRSDDCVICVTYDRRLSKPTYKSFRPKLDKNPFENSLEPDSDQNVKRQQKTWTKRKQHPAPWNLGAISEDEESPSSVTRRQPYAGSVYYYEDNAGGGVDIYVIEDTLFSIDNPEIKGRASKPFRVDPEMEDPTDADHASCVASVAAGENYGVAKRANLVGAPLIVWGLLELAEVLTQILEIHKQKVEAQTEGFYGSIINISSLERFDDLSDRSFEIIIDATRFLDDEGVLVVACSDNSGEDVGGGNDFALPCQLPGVVCVGASTRDDKTFQISGSGREERSSHGTPISIWAPGYSIPCSSDYLVDQGSHDLKLLTGTSFATPHVAGAAALFLGYEGVHDNAQLGDTIPVRKFLFGNAKRGWLEFAPGRYQGRNLLLNTGITSVSEFSPKPFKDPFVQSTFLMTLEDEVTDTKDHGRGYSPPRINRDPDCFGQSSEVATTWIRAQTLFFRLRWERGHINMYNPEDPRSKEHGLDLGYDKPIPCFEGACVLLYSKQAETRKRVLIPDATLLSNYVLHIINKCTHEGSDENDKTTDMVGGEIEMIEFPGLFIRLADVP